MNKINLIPIGFLLIFYAFFFARNIILTRKLKKSIKEKNMLVNLSIIFSALSFIGVIIHLTMNEVSKYAIIRMSNQALFIAGSALILLGVILSILASSSLKNSWRVGIPSTEEKTELIKTGMYKFSRNPYFTSFFVVFIGKFLVAPNILVLVSIIGASTCFHLMVLKEEKYLSSLHGEDYAEYKKSVGRYFKFF